MTLFTSLYSSILTTVLLFSFTSSTIITAIVGRFIHGAEGSSDGPYVFALVVTVWTYLSVIPLIALALFKPNNVLLKTKWAIVNLGLLFALWLAGSIWFSIDGINGEYVSCRNGRFYYYGYITSCGLARTILAFFWITWAAFLVAFGGLLTLAFIEKSKGYKDVYSTSVYAHPFGATPARTHGDSHA